MTHIFYHQLVFDDGSVAVRLTATSLWAVHRGRAGQFGDAARTAPSTARNVAAEQNRLIYGAEERRLLREVAA